MWRGVYDNSIVAIKLFLTEGQDVAPEINLMRRVREREHVLELLGVVIEQHDPYKVSF